MGREEAFTLAHQDWRETRHRPGVGREHLEQGESQHRLGVGRGHLHTPRFVPVRVHLRGGGQRTVFGSIAWPRCP